MDTYFFELGTSRSLLLIQFCGLLFVGWVLQIGPEEPHVLLLRPLVLALLALEGVDHLVH